MKRHLKFSFLFYLICLHPQLFAQMEVTDATTPPFTPENLISNIFLGDGVSVLDIQYQGSNAAVGYFKDGANAIGIDRGILMTSGRAAAQNCNSGPFGADCVGSSFANNANNNNTFDADLNQIANGTPQDVTKYIITFQPFADTLRFRYVFASEEYPEFSCSAFNDVFGFFISGPGITGPFSNNGKNIALIPGTNTSVSIDNIHPPYQQSPGCVGVNDQYYNNNNFSQLQPVYDGYLDVFTAEAVVVPCETYTIKLVISDVGDPNYDSGVFLEAKSFGTGTIEVEAATISLDGTITEGCSNGSFTFSLQQDAESDLYLDYTIIGTAENGVDYETIPDNLFIPQGESSLTVAINGIVDDLDEGLEGIGIDIQRDICNRDTFWIYIRDNEIVPPQLGPNQSICTSDSVALDGNLPLPLPDPPSFTNDQNYFIDETEPVYSPIQVVGVQPAVLGPGVIQSVCINIEHKWVDDLDIYLISPGGLFIELSTMNGANCDNYNNVCFSPSATTPINYTFPWPTCSSGGEPGFSNGTFQPEGIWEDLWSGGDSPTNGTWQLLVLDETMGFDGEILDWTITFEPLYQLYYEWMPAEGLSCADCPAPMASPDVSTEYVLRAWDTYGCEVFDTIIIDVQEPLPAPIVNCVSVTNNSISFAWPNVPTATGYQVSINGGPFGPPNNGTNGHSVTGLNLDETVTIEVMTEGACGGLIGSAECTTPSCNAPALIIDNISHVECFGEGNGVINAEATGGAGNYMFTLNGMNGNTGGLFTGLDGGVYEVTVIDGWGCPNSINVTVNEPDKLMGMIQIVKPVSCFNSNNGSATIILQGGTAPYEVNWSNSQQGDTVTNLAPGSHFVFVTDYNDCVFNTNFPMSQPVELEIAVSSTNISCAGGNSGTATVEADGGTPPYSYQWDANAGNANTATVTGLPQGVFTVAVTDANGCVVLGDATVSAPQGMVTDISKTDVQCAGVPDGTASISTVGGNGPYTYLWSNGQTTPGATGLDADQYFVTVTDVSGCTAVDSVVIDSPPVLELSLTANDALCFGEMSGNAQSAAVGGTPPYQYAWDNGQTTDVLQNVGAGTYCLEVTDGNGCQVNDCIEISEPPAMSLTPETTNAACNSAEGTIGLDISNGTAPFQYNWSDGQTTDVATGLLPGDYTVTVSDANGCTATASATIIETEAISIGTDVQDVRCNGENNGSISVSPVGGSGIYNYSWSGPNGFTSTGQNLSNIAGGVYQLEIEDSDGCRFSTEIEVLQPADPLDLTFEVQDVSCPGRRDGGIYVEGIGGTPPYRYQLDSNGFGSSANFFALPHGLYDISVTDANGCLFELGAVFVDEPEPFSVELGDDIIASYGDLVLVVGTVMNVADSLLDDYDYEWESSNPQMPPNNPNWRATTIDATGQTTLTLTVTSPTGCVEEDFVNFFVQSFKSVQVPTGFTPGNSGPAENNLLHVHGRSNLVENINLFQVFDRWGELLYEATDFAINDLSVGWDGKFKGKDMPPGVYVWYLDVDFVDGTNQTYKGHTTLIR